MTSVETHGAGSSGVEPHGEEEPQYGNPQCRTWYSLISNMAQFLSNNNCKLEETQYSQVVCDKRVLQSRY